MTDAPHPARNGGGEGEMTPRLTAGKPGGTASPQVGTAGILPLVLESRANEGGR